jgi:arabinofuranosyltransferase
MASPTGATLDEPPAPVTEGEREVDPAPPSDAPEPAGSDLEPEDVPSLREWLDGAPLPRVTHLLLGLVAPALVLLVNMWRVRRFTIDDAYISYRYARNLAGGLGLVYNAGERIEGFTNFSWTVILAGGIALGIDPDLLAKLLGGAFALGTLGMTYVVAGRFAPFGAFPCVATWLLASSIVTSGYAVFGLETAMFVFLVLLGVELMWREEARAPTPRRRAWFGLV